MSSFVVCYIYKVSTIARFKKIQYNVCITDHAKARMIEREIAVSLLISIIETGEIKSKPKQDNAFWVFSEVLGRTDNLICVSLAENFRIVVVFDQHAC